MSLEFESVVDEELVEKAKYYETNKFSWIHHKPNPEIPISVKWGTRPFFLPQRHKNFANTIENFNIRPDDVWVVSFPKCGCTWVQEMVWLICNNLDYESAKKPLVERFPFLDVDTPLPVRGNIDPLKYVESMPSPRFIKSHLPAPLLPKQIWTIKPKIVYVARNAKDTAVSFYHFFKNLFSYQGKFDDFVEIFLRDALFYAPYDAHIMDFWNMRDEENILFLTYEDMKANLPDVIRKTTNFFSKNITTNDINILSEHLSFNKMSNNLAVNFSTRQNEIIEHSNIKVDKNYRFHRKGQVGSYIQDMSPEIIEKFDLWIKKRHRQFNGDLELLKIMLLES